MFGTLYFLLDYSVQKTSQKFWVCHNSDHKTVQCKGQYTKVESILYIQSNSLYISYTSISVKKKTNIKFERLQKHHTSGMSGKRVLIVSQ